VLTNSTPVPLSPGRRYLGAFRRDAGPVAYTILAKELDATNGAGWIAPGRGWGDWPLDGLIASELIMMTSAFGAEQTSGTRGRSRRQYRIQEAAACRCATEPTRGLADPNSCCNAMPPGAGGERQCAAPNIRSQ
jgi:hypothetical protein